MIKKILLGLLALIVIVVAGLMIFVSPDVSVERSIVVNTPASYAFDQANILKNWENWSPWMKLDPNMKISYNGESGVGSSYSWESENKNAGAGTLTIIESVPNSSIKTNIDFGDQGKGDGSWVFEPEGDKTKVTWGFHFNVGNNPIGRFFALMAPKSLGKSLNDGLTNLKAIAEAEAAKPKPEVEASSTDEAIESEE